MPSLPWHVDAEHHRPVVSGWWRVGKLYELRIEALCHGIARIPNDPLGLSRLSDDEDALKAGRLANTRCVNREAVLDRAKHHLPNRAIEGVLILFAFRRAPRSLCSCDSLLELRGRLRTCGKGD